jgi:hypothetical protein
MRDAVFKDTLKMGNKLLGALEGHVQEQQITIGDPVVNVQQMISSWMSSGKFGSFNKGCANCTREPVVGGGHCALLVAWLYGRIDVMGGWGGVVGGIDE